MSRFPSLYIYRFMSRKAIVRSLETKLKDPACIRDDVTVSVESMKFNSMSEEDQRKAVMDVLPDKLKQIARIETTGAEGVISREVIAVKLRDVSHITRGSIPPTPQTWLDLAVYHLDQGHSSFAGECLWLSGSLSLKNFSMAYGVDTNNHTAKHYLVMFVGSQFGQDIETPWLALNQCHTNAYTDTMPLEMVRNAMQHGETFCNMLYTYHQQKKFDFWKALPPYMHKVITQQDKTKIKRYEQYFTITEAGNKFKPEL